MFGLSFLSLFSSMLIAKDRTTSFVLRLFTSPLKPADFILGYTLPMLPMALLQSVVCYLAAMIFALRLSANILLAVVVNIPIAVVFIALGLLFGTILNEKAVGGVCGALLTNVCGWLAGIWFDLSLVGGAFERIAGFLPFVHAVEVERAALSGDFGAIFPHMWWVLGYALAASIIAVVLFMRQMKRQ